MTHLPRLQAQEASLRPHCQQLRAAQPFRPLLVRLELFQAARAFQHRLFRPTKAAPPLEAQFSRHRHHCQRWRVALQFRRLQISPQGRHLRPVPLRHRLIHQFLHQQLISHPEAPQHLRRPPMHPAVPFYRHYQAQVSIAVSHQALKLQLTVQVSTRLIHHQQAWLHSLQHTLRALYRLASNPKHPLYLAGSRLLRL